MESSRPSMGAEDIVQQRAIEQIMPRLGLAVVANRDFDLKRVDVQPVAITQRIGLPLWETIVERVDVNAVRARILDVVGAVDVTYQSVSARHVRISEDPIIVGVAADRAARRLENLPTLGAQVLRPFPDNLQCENHAR